jgi:pantetheine-phosphate adenylyltransferase
MDFESEYTMAVINRQLGNVETLMLPARPELVGMSSSAVRELVSFGGAIDRLVPEGTDKKILQMARENAMR